MKRPVIALCTALLFLALIFHLLNTASPGVADTEQQQGAASPVELITSAQTLSTTWQDLGPEINTSRYQSVALWSHLVISDSADFQVQLLAKHTAAVADEYVLPISTVGASDVKVVAQYIEFNTDADQKMVISWDVLNTIPLVQFRIRAGTVGTTAGVISSAYVTLGY